MVEGGLRQVVKAGPGPQDPTPEGAAVLADDLRFSPAHARTESLASGTKGVNRFLYEKCIRIPASQGGKKLSTGRGLRLTRKPDFGGGPDAA